MMTEYVVRVRYPSQPMLVPEYLRFFAPDRVMLDHEVKRCLPDHEVVDVLEIVRDDDPDVLAVVATREVAAVAGSVAQCFAAESAAKIAETVGARGRVYATPETNFAQIAEFWRMWMRWRYSIDVPLNAADVGAMQAGIKLSRHSNTPTHADTALDAAVYILLAAGCAQDAAIAAQGD